MHINRIPPDKVVDSDNQIQEVDVVATRQLPSSFVRSQLKSDHSGDDVVQGSNGSVNDDALVSHRVKGMNGTVVATTLVDLVDLSHKICDVLDSDSGRISNETFQKLLSSASDEFGEHLLLGPLDKVLNVIPIESVVENSRRVKEIGLDNVILNHISSKRQERIDNGGMSIPMIRSFFNEFPQLDDLIDLVENGAKWLQKDDFVCNGLAGCNKFSKSYLENIEVCNHTIANGIETGQIIPLFLDELADEQVSELHLQSYELASKFGVDGKPSSTGRLCQNSSDGGAKSRNSGIDRELMGRVYPPECLTNGSKISELACEVRDRHPNEKIFGTMIDITNAYGQNLQSLRTAKTSCSLAKVLHNGKMRVVVCIYVEMMFGGAESGAAYALTGRAISWAHNRAYHQSERYVDDFSLLNSMSKIISSEELCVRIICALFGKFGVNPDKLIRYEEDLISIGWRFNLRRDVWKVMPKPKALRKLFACVFVWIAIGQQIVTSKLLEKVVGVLNHYLRVIPLAEASIKSLYACMDYSGFQHVVTLSREAMDDLDWLRAVIMICMMDPELMCVSIDHFRINVIVEAYVRTDAATTIGGGGALGMQADEDSPVILEARIRWSDLEFRIFVSQGVSINILELFAGIYHVLLWGDQLKGKVVKLFCDNTAAVSWLNSKRGNVKSVGGVALLRVLSVYCMIQKIRIVSEHIPGIKNIRADRLSRELYVILQDGSEESTEDENWWRGLSREATCRKLLKIAIVQPELLHLKQLLGVVQYLLSTPGVDTVKLQK